MLLKRLIQLALPAKYGLRKTCRNSIDSQKSRHLFSK